MAQLVKHFPANAGDARDAGLIPASERFREDPWVRRKTWQPAPVFLSMENSMDRGALWATVHGVTKSQTHIYTHIYMYIFIYYIEFIYHIYIIFAIYIYDF